MENSKPLVIGGKIKSWSLVENKEVQKQKIISTNIVLPDDSPARVKVLRGEGKKWYVTIVYHEETDQPFALFVKTNHPESSASTSDAVERLLNYGLDVGIKIRHIEETILKSKNENNVGKLSRTISLLLRHGVLIKNIVATLDKMEDIYVGSFLFVIKKFLSQYIMDGEVADEQSCSACGGQMVFSEGCLCCSSCGASKCG